MVGKDKMNINEIKSVTGVQGIPYTDGEKSEKRIDKDPITGKFLPGNKASPGKPVGTKHLSTMLLEMMFEKPEGGKDTHGTLLNKRVLRKAIADGDMRAIELVYDRIEGGVPRSVDLTTKGEKITPSDETQKKINDSLEKFLNGNKGDI